MVRIIKDIDLINDINKYDLIIIGTNINCNLSQGLQRDIALNYSYVRNENFKTKYGDLKKLGTILECKSDNEPTIVLAYICKGFPPRIKKGVLIDYLNYESLENSLKLINILYKGKNIACPFLGCSRFDGNGDKDKVLKIIESTLTDVNVTIYDYFQKSRSEKLKDIRLKELEVKSVDYEKYHEMVKKRKIEAEKRFNKNGFARY